MDDERPHLEGLIPPRRLGLLLLGLRQARGDSLEDASARTGGAVSADRLLALETGESTPNDHELDALARAYAFELTDLVPQRVQLMLDYDERLIDAGGGFAAVVPEGTTLEEVLQRYLILVWALRGRQPGSYLQLRELDLHVLGDGLGVGTASVVGMLAELLDQQDWVSPYRHPSQYGRPRFATVVPDAGIMLCGGHGGALVFRPDRSAPAPVEAPPAMIESARYAETVEGHEPIAEPAEAEFHETVVPDDTEPAVDTTFSEPTATWGAEPDTNWGSAYGSSAATTDDTASTWGTTGEPSWGHSDEPTSTTEPTWGTASTTEPSWGATSETSWGSTDSWGSSTTESGSYNAGWPTSQEPAAYQPLYPETPASEPAAYQPLYPETPAATPAAYQPLYPETPAAEPEPAPARGLGLPRLGTSATDAADPFADLRRAFTADYDAPAATPEPEPAPAPAASPGADLASWFDRAATPARIVDDEPSPAANFLSSLAPRRDEPVAPAAPAPSMADSGDDFGMELRWGAALEEPEAPPSRPLPDWRGEGLVSEPMAVAEQLSSSNPFAHLYASDDTPQPEPTRPQPLVPQGLPYAVPDEEAALPTAAPAPWDPQGSPRLLRKLFPGKA